MIKYFILIILISAYLQIDNCEITEKVCKTCQEGHSLVEYYYGVRCIETTKLKEHQKIDINCIESSGGKCTYCKRDYVLSKKKNQCIYKPYCTSLDANDECQNCITPFKPFNGTCVLMPHCNKISNNRKCEECDLSYYIDENGDCKSLPNYCLKGNSTHCETCFIGYYLEKGKCKKVNIENCMMGNSTHCEYCNLNYYQENWKCKKITKEHCIYGNSTTCSLCEDGYYLENGECLKVTQVANCKNYSISSDNCSTCENYYYYYYKNSECKKIEIPNCISGSDYCSKCDDGYELNEKRTKCIQCTKTEKICGGCKQNYASFDYGKTCKKLDDEDIFILFNKNEGIDFNLAIIALILSLIL